jgi:hypothetical protein
VLKHPATGLEARLGDKRVRCHTDYPLEFPEKLERRLIRKGREIGQCQWAGVLVRNAIQGVPDGSAGWKRSHRCGVRAQSDELKCQLLQRKRIWVRSEQYVTNSPT